MLSSKLKRKINISSNKYLTDKSLIALSTNCNYLTAIDVLNCSLVTEYGIENSFELSELESLRAARSGINDDGLVVIGSRCGRLLKLNLEACLGVTTVGLKEILRNCKRLRKRDLTSCHNISFDLNHLIEWMVISRPSPRKIILPYSSLPSESQRNLFAMGVLFCLIKKGWTHNS
ncbi:hypothetical protein Vadar_002177 [Vaccinium darrowii]|uniref:Uncharacterized protein n=1 Tax=Vaccinium darrowii TaxID=229202 RepID=A0ACB7Z112_9ERIC|nr:hypothetical protein Vadar_002177 [Vaccinium darrowii]